MSIQIDELVLGRGEVRMSSSYDTYLSVVIPQLDSTNSIGQCENCEVTLNTSYQDKRQLDVSQTVDKILIKSAIVVNLSTMKINSSNFNRMFGGDGSSGDFFVGNNKTYFRTEIVFTYPDGSSTMTWIIPKTIIRNPNSFNLISLSEPSQSGFSVESLYPNHENWGDSSAKVVFS